MMSQLGTERSTTLTSEGRAALCNALFMDPRHLIPNDYAGGSFKDRTDLRKDVKWNLWRLGDGNHRLEVNRGEYKSLCSTDTETRYEFDSTGQFSSGEQKSYRWISNTDGQDVRQYSDTVSITPSDADAALLRIAHEIVLERVGDILGDKAEADATVKGTKRFKLRSVPETVGGGYCLSSIPDSMGLSITFNIGPDGSMRGSFALKTVSGIDLSEPAPGLPQMIAILKDRAWVDPITKCIT